MTNESTVFPTNTQVKPRSKAVIFLVALIVILLGVLAYLFWIYDIERKEAIEVQQQLVAEKDSIAKNLQEIMFEYQVLETDNVAIKAKLQEEQDKAAKLYAELKQLKQVSYNKIKEYQRELGTLRAIMRNMVQEIDSLNTINQALIAENIKVRQEYNISQKTVESLEQRTEELSQTVAKGSVIRSREIVIRTINSRNREVSRAKNVDKIQTCFVLTENTIAKPGARFVYIRILGPDGFILAKSNSDLFDFEGEKVVFSARREVDYQNADVEMCIYYNSNGELIAGKYEVSLFLDGFMIGHGTFDLK